MTSAKFKSVHGIRSKSITFSFKLPPKYEELLKKKDNRSGYVRALVIRALDDELKKAQEFCP